MRLGPREQFSDDTWLRVRGVAQSHKEIAQEIERQAWVIWGSEDGYLPAFLSQKRLSSHRTRARAVTKIGSLKIENMSS